VFRERSIGCGLPADETTHACDSAESKKQPKPDADESPVVAMPAKHSKKQPKLDADEPPVVAMPAKHNKKQPKPDADEPPVVAMPAKHKKKQPKPDADEPPVVAMPAKHSKKQPKPDAGESPVVSMPAKHSKKQPQPDADESPVVAMPAKHSKKQPHTPEQPAIAIAKAKPAPATEGKPARRLPAHAHTGATPASEPPAKRRVQIVLEHNRVSGVYGCLVGGLAWFGEACMVDDNRVITLALQSLTRSTVSRARTRRRRLIPRESRSVES
jgi:hypothetical protein